MPNAWTEQQLKLYIMKKTILFILTMYTVTTLFSQTGYDKVDQFDIVKDNWAKVELKGKFGFIDKDGKEVVKPIYNEIGQFDINRDGWAQVKLNGKYGFIDKDGKEVVKPIYDEIGQFDVVRKGWAQVTIKKKTSFIDKNGVEVLVSK
jgi:hypothetical protein